MIRRRVVVRGYVQGVGFRYWIARAAQARGVAGRAENRSDGSVEMVLEGDRGAVESLECLCREGPRSAVVRDVEIDEEQPEGLRGFETR